MWINVLLLLIITSHDIEKKVILTFLPTMYTPPLLTRIFSKYFKCTTKVSFVNFLKASAWNKYTVVKHVKSKLFNN